MTVRRDSSADAAATAMADLAARHRATVPLIPAEVAAARAESITRALRQAAEVLRRLRQRRSTAPYDRREIEAAEQAALIELAHARPPAAG